MRRSSQRSRQALVLVTVALSGGVLSACGGSSSDDSAKRLLEVQQAREDGRKQAQDEARQKDLADTAKSLKAEVKRLRSGGSTPQPAPSGSGTSNVGASSGSTRRVSGGSSSAVQGAPSCDRGPGSLVWRFTATQTNNGTTFDVRLCQTSNGSWYYGSTDSKGGGVSAVPLSGPEGGWRSTNGIYGVDFSGSSACLTVRVSGRVASGYPACGTLRSTSAAE